MSSQSRQIVTAFQRLALFWRAGQWQVAKELGLNPTQGEVLARVAARPERAADLAAALGISHASLSDTVSALDRKGLVRRRPDPDDGRARRVAATDAGKVMAARMPEAPAALEDAITGLAEAEALSDVAVFHAGTTLAPDGRVLTDGGRVLAVTATDDTLPAALDRAYDAMGRIHFPGMHYRRDIGANARIG